MCYGSTVFSTELLLKPCPPEPHNVALPGNGVFPEVIRLIKGHYGRPSSNTTDILYRKETGAQSWSRMQTCQGQVTGRCTQGMVYTTRSQAQSEPALVLQMECGPTQGRFQLLTFKATPVVALCDGSPGIRMMRTAALPRRKMQARETASALALLPRGLLLALRASSGEEAAGSGVASSFLPSETTLSPRPY